MIIPEDYLTKNKDGKLELYLNKQFHTKGNHYTNIILKQYIPGHVINFYGSHQLRKINILNWKIPCHLYGFKFFINQKDSLSKDLNLGYFLFEKIKQIYSMNDLDPIDGNILAIQNKYLIFKDGVMTISQIALSHELIFYRLQNNQIKFYQGYENWINNTEVYLNSTANIEIGSTKTSFKIKIQTQNKIFISSTSGFITFFPPFFKIDSGTIFTVIKYQHQFKKFKFDFWGLNDNTMKRFCLKDKWIQYEEMAPVYIKLTQYHKIQFYVAQTQIYFQIFNGKFERTNQKINYNVNLKGQLFSLKIQNKNKYLKLQNNNWLQSSQQFFFKNKPYGFYIFHADSIYKAWSALNIYFGENKYVDQQFLIYFSVQQNRFFWNKKSLYIDNNFRLTFQKSNELFIQEIQNNEYKIGFKMSDVNYYLYITSNNRFFFQKNIYTTFFASQTLLWQPIVSNFQKIILKYVWLNQTGNYLQNIQKSQPFRTQWYLLGDILIPATPLTVTSLNPVSFNITNIYPFPIDNSRSYNLYVRNINKTSNSNIFTCQIVAITYNFWNQNTGQYKIGVQDNKIKTINQLYNFSFHKIQKYIPLTPMIRIKGLKISDSLIYSQQSNQILTFRSIGQNIYITQKDFIWIFSISAYYLKAITNNVAITTFSFVNAIQNKINILCKTWKASNGVGYLSKQIINSQKVQNIFYHKVIIKLLPDYFEVI